jgi:hypothetical protein
MAVDTFVRRSRRAVLGGAVGAIAAVAAQAVAKPQRAMANGEPMAVGGAYQDATTTTKLVNKQNAETVFWAQSEQETGVAGSGAGQAIIGWSTSNIGIHGQSHTGLGVYGQSDSNTGAYGSSESNSGVRGWSRSTVGVYGISGSGYSTSIGLKVGVYGWGPATTGLVPSYGVYGKSASGLGAGVFGVCDAGIGVAAISQTGFALYAGGRVLFKTSGIGTIAAGSASVVVTPGVPIGDGTRILVTLHGDAGGSTVLKRVSRNTAAGTFKVILTAVSANPCAFSWFLIG